MIHGTSLGHPLAEREGVFLAEIAGETFALPRFTVYPGYLTQIEAWLECYEVCVPERISIRQWNTTVSFASTGRALALVPTSFAIGVT